MKKKEAISTNEKTPKQTVAIPDTMRERMEKRQAQIERLSEHVHFLKTINTEALTAFLEGQNLPENAEVTFNAETWEVELRERNEKARK